MVARAERRLPPALRGRFGSASLALGHRDVLSPTVLIGPGAATLVTLHACPKFFFTACAVVY